MITINKKSKIWKLVGCLMITFLPAYFTAQPINNISLKEAYQLYEKRYPSLKNADLLEEIHIKETELLHNTQLPSIFLKGDARLQTESVGFPNDGGVVIPFQIDVPLYSVKTYVEAQYNIYDGGQLNAQQKINDAQFIADKQAVEVERYSLKKHINQLCLNIELLRDQHRLLDFSSDNLVARKETISAAVEYGILLESELSKLEVQELEILALKDNIQSQQIGLVNILSQLLGIELSDTVKIEFPTFPEASIIPKLDRPEQTLFNLQAEAILAKSDMLEVQKKPQINAFAQTGLGTPNPLNFFDNKLNPYGIIGASIAWRITDWKRSKKQKELLSLQALKVKHAKESFEFNLESMEPKYMSEISRLSKQIAFDLQIADMQNKILETISAQLDEGVVTSTEYIIQLNTELKARQQLIIHETQLLNTQLEFWNTWGAL